MPESLPRYFIYLSYDGSAYHGWQVQPGAMTVQQCIEEALGKVVRKPVPIVGAGRTDAGVNARLMVAHVDLPREAVERDKGRLLRSLNSLTGRDIAIHDIVEAVQGAHARFDARRRTYRYFVHHRKNPFLRRYSHCMAPLDYDAMNEAASKLLDVDDFTSFAKLHTDNKTNICHVDTARWMRLPGLATGFAAADGAPATGMGESDGQYYFEISADRFLRNMVRAVVGTLAEVGRGKMSIEQFEAVIAARNRCDAGASMPGNALFLWDVEYADELFRH